MTAGHIQLSQQLYDIHWEDYFPWQYEGHEVRVTTPEICYNFIQNNIEEFKLLDESSGFFDEATNKRRLKYYELAGDFFSYTLDGRMIGFFIGTPVDWSSYYLRFVWILSQYRRKGFYQNFLAYLLSHLGRHGIVRALADVPPTNLAHLHIFNKLQFNATGFSVSDRWGAITHLTKFLDPHSSFIFLDRFCRGLKPQQKQKVDEITLKSSLLPNTNWPQKEES